MFEALACGIPLISARWEDCEGLFRPPGRDFLFAAAEAAMTGALRRLLAEPAAAAELVASGLETIRARHTCAHRVDELLSICAASLERTLLAAFIELLASQYPEDEQGSADLAQRQIALIEAWIGANLGEPFGLEDLAGVANLSARAVQLAFGRLRGCTPMQFVQRRRFEKARHLLRFPSAGTTVTAVAMDCGCFHLGRFAAAYRTLFGERPPETLARSYCCAI